MIRLPASSSLISIGTQKLLAFREMSKQAAKKSKNQAQKSKNEPVSQGPLSVDKQGNVSIKIQAKPGAKQNNITEINEEAIGVAISAPPVEGEANTELIKYFSSVLELRKSDVTLSRGSKSRQKTVVVTGITKEEILEKLKKEMENG